MLTVTINPAIDKAVELDKFRYGEMNRIDESSSRIAGKGYHAAIVNKTLEVIHSAWDSALSTAE